MAAETDGVDLSDPSASVLAHFGQEVRLARERTGCRRADFAEAINFGYALVAKIECGKRIPSREFAEACDAFFPNADGRFMRLWPLALKYAYPAWFRKYVELEQLATRIGIFNPHMVPGLVQTETYARAVLKTGRPPNLEDAVTARMERQRVLEGDAAPRLCLFLDTAALRRSAGGRSAMHEQLSRLRDLAESPPHVVQLIPEERGVYYGGTSPFGLLSFREGNDLVHVDGFPTGYMVAESEAVAEARNAYDLLKATALPPDDTAAAIDTIMKDTYG